MKRHTKYWQNLVTVILISGFLLSSTSTARAESISYEQLPGHFGGFSSDGPIVTVADDFQLDQSRLITNITWWGGYFEENLSTLPTDNFTVRLFADAEGQPGALIQTFAVGSNVLRTATGDFVNPPDPPDFNGYAEFKYSLDLPVAFLVDANTRYWLSIVNVPSSASWIWEVSDSLINLGVQRSFESGPWGPYFDNTAFRLQTIEYVPSLTVKIDIKPGSFPNSIKLSGNGIIPVAILSSSTFNTPSQVDKTSLTFGRTGDELSLVGCSTEDVNRDGWLDLLCNFTTQATGFQAGDSLGILKGKTVTDIPLMGNDSVRIIP